MVILVNIIKSEQNTSTSTVQYGVRVRGGGCITSSAVQSDERRRWQTTRSPDFDSSSHKPETDDIVYVIVRDNNFAVSTL
eukprot:scaffold2208_cov170-Ochromonas_danica.AAC.24